MTSQTGKLIISIHILTNISRSKGKQTIKFGQLIDMRNSFLEKSYTKCCGEVGPTPVYKKLKSTISLDQQSEMLWRLLLLYF